MAWPDNVLWVRSLHALHLATAFLAKKANRVTKEEFKLIADRLRLIADEMEKFTPELSPGVKPGGGEEQQPSEPSSGSQNDTHH